MIGSDSDVSPSRNADGGTDAGDETLSCGQDSDCDAQAHCSDAVCIANQADGSVCERDDQCMSGQCGTGICCAGDDC